MQGSNVDLLHTRPQLLGYDISDEEVQANAFDASTVEAVAQLQ